MNKFETNEKKNRKTQQRNRRYKRDFNEILKLKNTIN